MQYTFHSLWMVYSTEMLKELHSIYLPTLSALGQYVENYRLVLSVCLSFLSALKLLKKGLTHTEQ